jgi:hypothetical protein
MMNIFVISVDRGNFHDGRERLFAKFCTSKGGIPELEWTPKWIDVDQLLRQAVRVERANKPASEHLREFAELARDILIEHAPSAEVRRETAELVRYVADGRHQPEVEVQIRQRTGTGYWELGRETWKLGVPLPDPVLRFLARTHKPLATWVLWNEEIIDVLHPTNGRSLLRA